MNLKVVAACGIAVRCGDENIFEGRHAAEGFGNLMGPDEPGAAAFRRPTS